MCLEEQKNDFESVFLARGGSLVVPDVRPLKGINFID